MSKKFSITLQDPEMEYVERMMKENGMTRSGTIARIITQARFFNKSSERFDVRGIPVKGKK